MRPLIGTALLVLASALLIAPAAEGQALFAAEVTARALREGHVGFSIRIRASRPMLYSVGMAFALGPETDPEFLQKKAKWKIGAVLPTEVGLSIDHATAGVAYTQRDLDGRTRQWAGFTNMMGVTGAATVDVHLVYTPTQLRELLARNLDDALIIVQGIAPETIRSPPMRAQYSSIDVKLSSIPLPE